MTQMHLDIPQGDFAGYIFDCDGTLADSMPLHYRAWCSAIAAAGATFTFDEGLFYTLGGTPTRKIVGHINDHYGSSLDSESVALHKEQLYLCGLHEVRPIAEVVDFARRVAASSPVCVASGGSNHVVRKTLEYIAVADLFPILITPEQVARGKPHPDMFLLAAEKMGVEPSRCLVFDDGPVGFRAAEAAGMQWVRVPQPGRG